MQIRSETVGDARGACAQPPLRPESLALFFPLVFVVCRAIGCAGTLESLRFPYKKTNLPTAS